MNKNRKVISKLSASIFESYSNKIGSSQIATKRALEVLGKFLITEKPNVIFEIGSGIGTITNFIIRVPGSLQFINRYYSYENDEWCRKKFIENIQEAKSLTFVKFSNLQDLHEVFNVDLYIIDDRITELDLSNILDKSNSKFDVFIEGHRFPQRRELTKYLRLKNIRFRYLGYTKKSGSYKGAVIFRCNRDLKGSKLYSLTISVWLLILTIYMRYRSLRSKVSFRVLIYKFFRITRHKKNS